MSMDSSTALLSTSSCSTTARGFALTGLGLKDSNQMTQHLLWMISVDAPISSLFRDAAKSVIQSTLKRLLWVGFAHFQD